MDLTNVARTALTARLQAKEAAKAAEKETAKLRELGQFISDLERHLGLIVAAHEIIEVRRRSDPAVRPAVVVDGKRLVIAGEDPHHYSRYHDTTTPMLLVGVAVPAVSRSTGDEIAVFHPVYISHTPIVPKAMADLGVALARPGPLALTNTTGVDRLRYQLDGTVEVEKPIGTWTTLPQLFVD